MLPWRLATFTQKCKRAWGCLTFYQHFHVHSHLQFLVDVWLSSLSFRGLFPLPSQVSACRTTTISSIPRTVTTSPSTDPSSCTVSPFTVSRSVVRTYLVLPHTDEPLDTALIQWIMIYDMAAGIGSSS